MIDVQDELELGKKVAIYLSNEAEGFGAWVNPRIFEMPEYAKRWAATHYMFPIVGGIVGDHDGQERVPLQAGEAAAEAG